MGSKQLYKAVAIIVLLLAAGVLAAYLFSSIVVYVLLATLLSSILRTPTNFFSRTQIYGRRIPLPLAIFFSFSILFGVIGLFAQLFAPLISEQVTKIAGFDYGAFIEDAKEPIGEIEDFLESFGFLEKSNGIVLKTIKENLTVLLGQLQIGNIINKVISITGSIFVGFMAVLFITFFILFERGAIRRGIIAWIPNKYFEMTIAAVYKTERLLANYLVALLLQMLSVFAVVSFGLKIAGINYAITIGVFAALANLVPFAGPIIGTIFGITIGLTTLTGSHTTNEYLFLILKIAMVFGSMQLFDNLVLQPLVFSKSVKAHPLEIFVTVFAGASLAGLLGMILAIPAYTVLKVAFTEVAKGFTRYKVFKTNSLEILRVVPEDKKQEL